MVEALKQGGARIIRSINEVKYLENRAEIKVLIRAHGVSKDIIDELEENKIPYIDKTCKEVKKIHDIVYDMSGQGYGIIIIGDKNHPEIIGTVGWCLSEPVIIKNLEDAKAKIPDLGNSKPYCVVAQTTYNSQKYTAIVEYCKKYLQR